MKHTQTQPWIITQDRGNCYYKHLHSVAVLRSALMQTSHGEAARQKFSHCVPGRALCLLRASVTEGAFPWKIPDIFLTLRGNVSLSPKMWWLFEVFVLSRCGDLSESGRLSHSSKCLCALYVRTEVVRATHFLSRSDTVSTSKAAGPSSVTAGTLKTQIKDSPPPHPLAAAAFGPLSPLNVRVEGGRMERNSDRQIWHLFG